MRISRVIARLQELSDTKSDKKALIKLFEKYNKFNWKEHDAYMDRNSDRQKRWQKEMDSVEKEFLQRYGKLLPKGQNKKGILTGQGIIDDPEMFADELLNP